MTTNSNNKNKKAFFSKVASILTFGIADKIHRLKFDEVKYWEDRYIKGGDSGIGSCGELAQYKAGVINKFVNENNIQTVIEFGCGDGNQLRHYDFPKYVGLDISREAIKQCRNKFLGDRSKEFKLYDENQSNLELHKADLILSIDVLFHITDEVKFKTYLNTLFRFSKKYVIIYSTNFDKIHDSPHQIDRNFTNYISKCFSEFILIDEIKNPYKGEKTMSDFHIYKKI